MASSNIEMKINVSSKEATKKIENATRAAEKLQKALDKLKEIEIGVEVVMQLLDECIEYLGIVSQVEYKKVTGYKKTRRTLNNDMESGKIKFKKIGGIKFPMVNY